MKTLVFDTETAGLPDFKRPYSDPCQPEVLQFGMAFFDDRYPVFEMGFLFNPPRQYEINPQAAAVHGISTEMCADHGFAPLKALKMVTHWWSKADRVVAHNIRFDLLMMRALFHKEGVSLPPHRAQICTMLSSQNAMRWGKWPKLKEAYARLVDPAGFLDAHNASADVWACARILWALEDGGHKLEIIS